MTVLHGNLWKSRQQIAVAHYLRATSVFSGHRVQRDIKHGDVLSGGFRAVMIGGLKKPLMFPAEH